MSGRRNVIWIAIAGAVVLGLGAVLLFADGGERSNARKSSRGNPLPGKAKAVTVKAMEPLVPVEERWVEAPPLERPAAPEGALNVVVVVLTAARKDQLSPYGASAGVTPFLARLAGKGARFLDTIADSPYSRSASAAMLTGRHSWKLAVVEPGHEASKRKLPEDATTLAESFRAAGWWTGGGTGNFNLNMDRGSDDLGGISRGFDRYLNAQTRGFAGGRRQEAGFLMTQMLDLMAQRDADRPFFLQVDFIDTHAPIRVVEDQLGDFEPDQPHAEYRAALHRMDQQLERLWAFLGEEGLQDNTLFVVVSDHGEGLEWPAHHGRFHGRLLYETSVAVPWIVAGPGIPQNQLVGGLAAGVDVAPTVLDLAGLPVPEGLDGMSHADLLRGNGARTQRTSTYSATWQFTAMRGSSWTTGRQCQLDFGSIDVNDSFVDACYDRRTDPAFTRVVDDPESMDALRAWTNEVRSGL